MLGKEVYRCIQVYCNQLGLHRYGAKCTGRSCASGGKGTAKAVYLEVDGSLEGQNSV